MRIHLTIAAELRDLDAHSREARIATRQAEYPRSKPEA